jgi:extracellular factor (EF) 3-hydroxypalmitic acid methyl ester biosynthesis protein
MNAAVASNEDALTALRDASDSLLLEANRSDLSTIRAFHCIIGKMHLVCEQLRRCEEAGIERTEIVAQVARLREVCTASPFMRHIQTWPRGYSGDFEVIDQIFYIQNKAEKGTFVYWLEEYSLICGMSQQHRHKVARQAKEIETVIRTRAKSSIPARVLILACGSSPDLGLVQASIAEMPFAATLVDADSNALHVSRERLPTIVDRLTLIEGNVIKKVPELARRGPFDLVVAGGLFDYLPDKVAAFLIRTVMNSLLSNDGRFFFTNMAIGNPYEDWTRYVGDWKLIQRDEPDIDALLTMAGIDPSRARYDRDPTKLAVLVTLDVT